MSPGTLLATLAPALVAEAKMLREGFAHRYHSGSLFVMNSRNRRGESSRLGDITGSGLDRNTGDSSRQMASKLIETVGTPLVDKDALNALIRLLRVVQVIPFLRLVVLLFLVVSKACIVIIIFASIMYSLFTRASWRGFS